MEILLNIISGCMCIFCLFNFIFNGKTKYWELLTIIPTTITSLFLGFLIFISSFTMNMNSLIFSLLAFIFISPFLDFSVGLNKGLRNKNATKVKLIDMNSLCFYQKNNKELANYLEKKDPDIIVLQELYIAKEASIKINTLFPYLTFAGYHNENSLKSFFPYYKYISTDYDRGVVSKYPLEQIKSVQTTTYFGYTIFKIKIHNSDVYLVNVHMPFKKDRYFGFDEKKKAFFNLYKDIYELKASFKKIILTGDFNTTKNSRFVRKFFKIFNESIKDNNLGFHLSWQSQVLPLWRLDFCFYNRSEKFIFTKSRTVSNKFSDHKHLESEFEIL